MLGQVGLLRGLADRDILTAAGDGQHRAARARQLHKDRGPVSQRRGREAVPEAGPRQGWGGRWARVGWYLRRYRGQPRPIGPAVVVVVVVVVAVGD